MMFQSLHITIIDRQKQVYGEKVLRMDGYVFHLPDGTPISEKRLQNEIDKTVKRINTDGIEFDRFDNNKIFILPFLSRLTAMARWAWIF